MRRTGEDAPTLEIPRQSMAELIEEGRLLEELGRLAHGTEEIDLSEWDHEEKTLADPEVQHAPG